MISVAGPLAPVARLGICQRCGERPTGCWQAQDYACARQRLIAGRKAVVRSFCPLGKWGDRPPGFVGHVPKVPPRKDSPATLIQPRDNRPIDVVYFLSTESRRDDWELRYSLRSIEANFRNLGRVFIVGHRPAWLRGVEHLDIPDRHKKNKDANLIDKLLAVCRWGVSEWFLNPSDDQLLLEPAWFHELAAVHLDDLAARPPAFWGPGSWKARLQRTFRYLQAHGLPTYHHDAHVPMPIHRDAFTAAFAGVDYATPPGYTIHTFYANAAPIQRVPIGRRKAGFEEPCTDATEVCRRMEDRLYCGYNDAGLTPALVAEIERRFPVASHFETDRRSVAVPVGARLWKQYEPDCLRRVMLAGSDSLRVFGGLFEGGYRLQQVPEEAAAFLAAVRHFGRPHPRLLEVGSAAGGFGRLLDDELVCRSVTILDDNQHKQHMLRVKNLPHAVERVGNAGDAGPWLGEHGQRYDLVLIDTSHVYSHERRHVEVVLPHLAPGGLLAFHDVRACPGRDQVGRLVTEMKAGLYPGLEHVADLGTRLGLSVFRDRRDPQDDPLPAYQSPPATLLFHFCPWLGRPEMIAFHVTCLARYLHQFSKIRINCVTGEGFADPAWIEAQLRPWMATDDVRFFRNAHSPMMHGETVPFFKDLLPEVGDGENVCYGHSKGAMLSGMPGGRAWGELMYAHNMANSRAAAELLNRWPCIGPFVRFPANRGAKWHYAGTFFWFRDVRRWTGWNEHDASRYGVEAWLGRFVPLAEAYETAPRAILYGMCHDAGGLRDRYSLLRWEP